MNLETNQDYSQVYQELKKLPLFDGESFLRLAEDTDQTVILKILARFWVTLCESLDQIEEGLKEDKGEIIARACHKVSGSAELVGFKQYGNQSRSLNMSLKTMTDPQIHLNEIQGYVEDGRCLLKQIETVFPNFKSYL